MTWVRAVTLSALIPAALALCAGSIAIIQGAGAWPVTWFAATLIMGLPPLWLGILISARRPKNAIAALLSVAGLGVLVAGGSDVYLAAAELSPGVLPVSGLWISLTQGIWIMLYLPWALILLVFPQGQKVRTRVRVSICALVILAGSFNVLAGLTMSPYASSFQEAHRLFPRIPGAEVMAVALLPVFLGALIASLVSVIRRYRVSEPQLRNQYRWLALAGAVLPGTLLLCWAGYLLLGDESIAVLGLGVIYLLLPALVLIAILRPEILDAGAVLVRVVAAGMLLILFLALVAGAFWLGAGQVGANGPAVLGAGLGGALLMLQRPRAEYLVGRILYPERERVLTALSGFEARILRGEGSPEELEQVLRTATCDAELRIGYRSTVSRELLDLRGHRLIQEAGYPIKLGGTLIGLLLPGTGKLVAPPVEILRAMTLTLELGRQRLELSTALREVESSRERILAAGYQERERLERDLHDGAQQRLVALGMTLRLAQRQLSASDTELALVLEEGVAELGTAVAELRHIAHGMRPSSLDDGLREALTQLSGRSVIPLELELNGALEQLPELVSTTAYFVANEAVANAVKHANAERIGVRVDRVDEGLRVRVADDGRGGAGITTGGGLAGLADRIHALGGSICIASPRGGGTLVEAVLPCG